MALPVHSHIALNFVVSDCRAWLKLLVTLSAHF
jgi:hypothetical protein